jgi:molecular chaperone GrpE (heat shock protein)
MSKKTKKIELEENQISDNVNQDIEKLIQENKELIRKLEDMKQIATTSQSQYITLKYDFDAYISRMDRDKSQQKINSKMDSIKNIFPFIENLRKTIEHIPEKLKDNDFAK